MYILCQAVWLSVGVGAIFCVDMDLSCTSKDAFDLNPTFQLVLTFSHVLSRLGSRLTLDCET